MEYLNRTYSSPAGTFADEEGNPIYSGDLLADYRDHINRRMFWGFDFDTTMLRVSSMNMLLHGVSSANILYQDSLNKSIKQDFPRQEENFFDVILANPPFKGSLDESNVNPDVLGVVKTKKTELLFVAHILRALKLGGRAAVIVPDGVLFGSSNAHQQLRQALLEQNQLEGIVSLPSGVFKPYAGVSTAILIFTKGGVTERVWFYDVQADGYSLDDKRTPIAANDLPQVITRWQEYRTLVLANATAEAIEAAFGDKTQQAFVVAAADIAANKFDLSINRYKDVVYAEERYDAPKVILGKLKALEQEILADLEVLEKML
jgi:type I restriction enzyme M protein